ADDARPGLPALRDLGCGRRAARAGDHRREGHGHHSALARRVLRLPGRGRGRCDRAGGASAGWWLRVAQILAESLSEAIVVGSGPNGLACAVALAREGVKVTVLEAEDRIGGGTRTSELTEPGLLHDDCSATHPMAVGSPFLNSLGLDQRGLEWRWPEIDLAHPLDDAEAGVMVR